jgi:hypothetical protein
VFWMGCGNHFSQSDACTGNLIGYSRLLWCNVEVNGVIGLK